jgi:hypothetical protein
VWLLLPHGFVKLGQHGFVRVLTAQYAAALPHRFAGRVTCHVLEASIDIDNRLIGAGRIDNQDRVIEMIDDLFQYCGIQALHGAKSVEANDRNFKDLYP